MLRIARIGESDAPGPERGNGEDSSGIREESRDPEKVAGRGEDREGGCGGGGLIGAGRDAAAAVGGLFPYFMVCNGRGERESGGKHAMP